MRKITCQLVSIDGINAVLTIKEEDEVTIVCYSDKHSMKYGEDKIKRFLVLSLAER